MELIFFGYPGSGKGTQAAILAKRYAIPQISTGDIFRNAVKNETPMGLKAKKYLDSGELVPDDIVVALVAERLQEEDAANGFILDGFPRTLEQARALDEMLQKRHRAIDAVIELSVDKDVIVRRITSRRVCRDCQHVYNLLTEPPPESGRCLKCGGEIIQRKDDSEETIMRRMEVYDKQTRPLREYFEAQAKLIQIDGSSSIEQVRDEIERRLQLFIEGNG